MTDDIEKYTEHDCPKSDDGIHQWGVEDEDTDLVTCDLCGAHR